jgi:hypothetical protein
MKFLTLTSWPVEKTAEVSAASDKVSAHIPRERRHPGYVLMCALPDVPPNSMVSVTIGEGDSVEEIAANVYPMMLAGATVNVIPLLEVPAGGSAKAEKKYRGK